MGKNQSVKGNFIYNNIEKLDKNFMYKNLERSNCYNCEFSGSNFNFVNFRGAHFKSCVFFECTFMWAEFIGTNLKGSDFENAKFENTLFDSVNLEGVDFKDAEFINTIFLSTDITKAINLSVNTPGIKIYDEMPVLEISDELRTSVLNVMKNKFVKSARVLDTKDGGINVINLMILLTHFDEETLIKGLNIIETDLNCDFHTLSYIVKYLKNNM
ncbi:pentapeptide repeat-containing protein [Clostridium lacusfryxellense]|uniref:pentapeptide repeat-containing protein n=1 Tax=Clostridium lacusfryxellense TaxID=205328 RepID=UPI001C0AB2CB|nr:pentapeptide repeat-containing protein [Clostridium lacusfryxellense]MBU3111149.1 pentapeptide repeat-containing protein [Clostridium lacusfryxellense]